MFSVPGWSLSADDLKSQVKDIVSESVNDPGLQSQNGAHNHLRKRKRAHNSLNKSSEITEENLSGLWKRYVEQKGTKDPETDRQISTEKRKKEKERDEDITVEEVGEPDNRGKKAAHGYNNRVGNEEQEDLVRRKKKKNRRLWKDPENVDKDISDANPTEQMSSPVFVETSALAGKSRYEERKSKAVKKGEQKSQLHANGTLPSARLRSKSTPANEPRPVRDSEHLQIPSNVVSLEKPLAENKSGAPGPLNVDLLPKMPDRPAASAKLTPLQQRMVAKLTSARFRHLNQTLYTSTSDRAMRLFTESPQAYNSYHEGFRAQVAIWPQNPVDGFIEDIKSRNSTTLPSQMKMWKGQRKAKGPQDNVSFGASAHCGPLRCKESLPRDRQGTCTIADLGCGDASLVSAFLSSQKALNLNILSFDLAKGNTPNANLITVSDISDLSAAGVKSASVDIAICCLSLMGTNWVSIVDECARVVRAGGEMWVAEIKSRFTRVRHGKEGKLDNNSMKGKKRKNKVDGDEEKDEEATNLMEADDIDGETDKDGTDVSTFAEVFRRRGFNLKGEPDVGNKMFVRMRFIKAYKLERTRENEKGGAAKFGDGFKGKQRAATKFLDAEQEVDESEALKPCVYKTR